jgi:hypothetical protein
MHNSNIKYVCMYFWYKYVWSFARFRFATCNPFVTIKHLNLSVFRQESCLAFS